jgi:YidC/Oxa1 family membrane protein insertase
VTEEKVRADMMPNAKKPKKKSAWQQRLEEAQKMQEQMQKQQNRR